MAKAAPGAEDESLEVVDHWSNQLPELVGSP